MLYRPRLTMNVLVLLEDSYVKTGNSAVCSKSCHVVHELHGVFDRIFAKKVVSQAASTLLTSSAVRGVVQHQFQVLVQSGTRLQLMVAFQLVERNTSDEAVLCHGYLRDLNSRFCFRL